MYCFGVGTSFTSLFRTTHSTIHLYMVLDTGNSNINYSYDTLDFFTVSILKNCLTLYFIMKEGRQWSFLS